VSCCAPPGLHLNHWYAFMKSYPGCELLCTSWAPFESLICLYEILSSEWVAVHLLGSIWITDMPLWNPIQLVSCCAPPGLHLNHWYAFMKSYPACELLCTSWAPFESLTCLYEILSSKWVVVHLLGSIWITDMLLCNPIQHVSCCAPPGLYLNHWYPFIKSYPACELLCISWASLESLIWLFMILYPGCELLCIFWAPLESLICLYDILSRKWIVHLLGSIWITNILLSHLVQFVPIFFHLLPSPHFSDRLVIAEK